MSAGASRGLLLQRAHSLRTRAPCGTMTDSGPKFKTLKLLKLILSGVLVTVSLLFAIASIRTLSLDVNVGLQLARWEKTNNISLVVSQQQREELLDNFKGKLFLLFACLPRGS